MTFSDKLKKLREDKQMTQKDLAKHLGVTPRIISYYETGKSIPNDPDLLKKLVSLFNITLDYLLLDSKSDADFKLHRLIIKLINDTKNNILHWEPFVDVINSEETYQFHPDHGQILVYEETNIIKNFDMNQFPQFTSYTFSNDQSYFATIEPSSTSGYLLLKLHRKDETLISLLAYISGKFKFISDMHELPGIKDLYTLAQKTDIELDTFIDKYLDAPSF